MKQYINKILLALIGFFMFTACNLEENPTDKYDEETFWHSAKTSEAGLTGCYAALLETGLYGDATAIWEETASPNAYNYHNSHGWNSIALGTHTSDQSIFSIRWKAAFTGIGRCNLLINNIDKSKELSADRITSMKAQARFLRALYYHILTIYYDKVPLIFDTPSLTQWNEPRANREKIVEFILGELDEVAKILPKVESGANNAGRPTSGAALALKAKILLFEASPLFNTTNDKNKWQSVVKAIEAVFNTKSYGLFKNYRELFYEQNENSVESIFDVQFIRTSKYGSSFDLILRQYNSCAPVHNLVESYWMADGKPRESSQYINAGVYDNLDPRFYQTIVYPGSTFMGEVVKTDGTNSKFTVTQTGYTFKKYSLYDTNVPTATDLNTQVGQSPINYMIIRYADVMLWYAEAKNELGELTEDVWNQTIKLIRSRAGFVGGSALTYPGNDYNELLKHIRYERKIEFAGEGYYYNDIRRWRTAERELVQTIKKHDNSSIIVRGFNAQKDYLWPVPSTQIEIAPLLLPNNPGW